MDLREQVDLRAALTCELDASDGIVSVVVDERTPVESWPIDATRLVPGQAFLDLVHDDDRATVARALPMGTSRSVLCRLHIGADSWTWVELEVAVSIDGHRRSAARIRPADQPSTAERVATDVLIALLHHVGDGVLACDADGFIIVLNRAMRDLLCLGPGAPVPSCWPTSVRLLSLSGDRVLGDHEHPLVRANLGEHVRDEELLLVQPNGTVRHVVANGQPLPAQGRRAAGAAIAFRDVTEQRRSEADLRRQALHDPLTELPNRLLLSDRLGEALRERDQSGHRVAVMFFDLDHFKEINDSLGHSYGDVLLTEIARRLADRLPQGATLARLGGDEFVVLLSVREAGEARSLALRLESAMVEPFSIAEHDVVVTASIGVALDEGTNETSSALLRNADAAMYEAKRRGRNRVHMFDRLERLRPARRFEQRRLLQRAIDSGEIVVHFQPIVDVSDGRLVGAEALVRLIGPEGTIIGPGAFLEVAEDTGLITKLDSLVLDRALASARRWHDLVGKAAPIVSVNVSAHQLARPDFAHVVHSGLDRHGLAGSALFLELTESSLLTVTERTVAALHDLRERGVHLGLDDFGIGYSSLRLVGDLPFGFLKIDRSFVAGLTGKPSDGAVVRVILDLCRQLDLRVMAEGIEDPAQLEILQSWGCHWLQGFLLARPMPQEQLVDLLLGPSPVGWLGRSHLGGAAA